MCLWPILIVSEADRKFSKVKFGGIATKTCMTTCVIRQLSHYHPGEHEFLLKTLTERKQLKLKLSRAQPQAGSLGMRSVEAVTRKHMETSLKEK